MKSRRRIALTEAGTTPNRTQLQQGFATSEMGFRGQFARQQSLSRQCPLWVISGHWGTSEQCPLYPRKRTLRRATSMSALCQKQTLSGLNPIGGNKQRAHRRRGNAPQCPGGKYSTVVAHLPDAACRHAVDSMPAPLGSAAALASEACSSSVAALCLATQRGLCWQRRAPRSSLMVVQPAAKCSCAPS